MKFMTILASLLVALSAQANDGSFAYVDVLGVAPKNIAVLNDGMKGVQVYGEDAYRMAQLFPYNWIHEASYFNFVSNNWNIWFWCPTSYVRPTTGEVRYDTMCEIGVSPFSVELLEMIKSESDYEQFTSLPTGLTASGTYKALGINPNGVAKGELFDIYGDDAYVLNSMINGGTLRFNSKAHSLVLSCKKDYQRPTTGEWRSDYMCTMSLL